MKSIDFFDELLKQIDCFTSRLNQLFYCVFSKIPPTGLSATERMVMMNSRVHGAMSISALGRLSCNLKPSHIGTVVNKLTETGLMKKRRAENDERVFVVELTENGQELVGRHIVDCKDYLDNKFFSLLTESDAVQFREGLVSVLAANYRYINYYGIFKYEYEDRMRGMSLYELLDRRTQSMNMIFLNMDDEDIFFNKEKFNVYQNNVILFLYENRREASISRISSETNIKMKYLSLIIKGLASKGFLYKFHKNGDERTKYVELTEKSKAFIEEQDMNEKMFFLEKFSRIFSDEELDALLSAHIEINAALLGLQKNAAAFATDPDAAR